MFCSSVIYNIIICNIITEFSTVRCCNTALKCNIIAIMCYFGTYNILLKNVIYVSEKCIVITCYV